MKVSVIPIMNGVFGTVPEGLIRNLKNWESEDHPNYSIVEFGQNTEKSPRDLQKLVATQTPVKDHQLTLV